MSSVITYLMLPFWREENVLVSLAVFMQRTCIVKAAGRCSSRKKCPPIVDSTKTTSMVCSNRQGLSPFFHWVDRMYDSWRVWCPKDRHRICSKLQSGHNLSSADLRAPPSGFEQVELNLNKTTTKPIPFHPLFRYFGLTSLPQEVHPPRFNVPQFCTSLVSSAWTQMKSLQVNFDPGSTSGLPQPNWNAHFLSLPGW